MDGWGEGGLVNENDQGQRPLWSLPFLSLLPFLFFIFSKFSCENLTSNIQRLINSVCVVWWWWWWCVGGTHTHRPI